MEEEPAAGEGERQLAIGRRDRGRAVELQRNRAGAGADGDVTGDDVVRLNSVEAERPDSAPAG